MKDHAINIRRAFIDAVESDIYAAKRAAAIKWLRKRKLYVLDSGSRKYTPSVPQDQAQQ